MIIGGYILLQVPLTKQRTDVAWRMIEENHLRINLTDEEKKDYEIKKNIIQNNERYIDLSYMKSRKAGLILCLLFIINNIGLLVIDRKNK